MGALAEDETEEPTLGATSGTCGDNLIWSLNTSTGKLTISGTGAMYNYSSTWNSSANAYITSAPWGQYYSSIKTVVIASEVTSIGDCAFEGCSKLASVTIPDSVTSIGGSAFYNCSSLVSITIPDGVTSIGSGAFYNCGSLTNIDVSENNTYYASIDGVLFNKDKTTLIEYPGGKSGAYMIPNGVTSIGYQAFAGCSSLTSVTIPDSVANIGGYAFYNCSSLTSVTIPDSVTSLPSGLFNGCRSLENITLPFVGDKAHSASDTYQYPLGYIFGTYSYTGGTETTQYYYGSSTSSITSSTFYIPPSMRSVTITGGQIPYGAFENCSMLTSITLGDSVTSIGGSAFYNCSSLTSMTIPDSVTSIGDRAFYNCSSLTSVTIPDSVTSIGSSAFNKCSKLTSITIPDSVTSIGGSAFYNCGSLTNIDVSENNTYYASIDGVLFNKDKTTLIEYPGGKSGAYTIPDSVTSIGGSAFYNCSSLTSVTIPDSVTSIGDRAFYNCSSLICNEYDNAYYLGNTDNPYVALLKAKNTSISTCSINSNTGLIIGEAFYNCSKLISVTIPDSVTSIGYEAFSGCSSLRSVTIPDSVTSIGNYAFSGCNSIRNLVISNSTETIGSYAFNSCSKLTSVTIPDSVTSIGYEAFSGCSSLTNVTIPSSVISIESGAFSGCNSLTDVYYGGTEAEWMGVMIWDGNDLLLDAEVHFEQKQYKLGDVNKDGVINGKDVTLLRRYLAGGYGVTLD